ncbi:MAG TPA: hydrolase [Syntrophomonadaceae bacterium]|nr:hydrolase [Syntrophomonadaceae bacterium]
MTKFKLEVNDSILLIIDLQERLMSPMKDKEQVYKNTNLLIETAKQLDIPILLSEQYPKGLGTTVDEIKSNLPEHYYLDKVSFSACIPNFNSELESLGRKNIIVTGSETHICVFQTVRDLIGLGYNVHLAKDAVCSRTDENKNSGIELMKDVGAVISNTETIVFDLLKEAGTPEFKAISPLLK